MTLVSVAAALALLGLALLVRGVGRLRRRRVLAAGGHGLAGAALLALVAVLGLIGLDLHTYARLTHERPVAELSFHKLGPERYDAVIRFAHRGTAKRYRLEGDQWEIDARILKWRGFANLLGFDARYRLERLSGRYQDVAAEQSGARSVYALAGGSGLDLWTLAHRFRGWLPWVDAIYGSATYLPMADNARFEVLITQSGLMARALNPAAQDAVRNWR